MQDLLEKVKGINSLPKHLRKTENNLAKLIAIAVRNQMEEFHGKYLSDKQMAELNPIIRNAIYTSLIQLRENTEAMYAYGNLYLPDDWEDCELLDL